MRGAALLRRVPSRPLSSAPCAATICAMTAEHDVLGHRLRLITPEQPLYTANAEELDALVCGEPWWAFCWPGSFALADCIQRRPELVRGKNVLDVASGCGIAALAALEAGARRVTVNEIDPWALDAVTINARRSDHPSVVSAEADGRLLLCQKNLVGCAGGALEGVDVLLGGDICYEQPLASQMREWLRLLLGRSQPPLTLIGDPGRPAFVETFASTEGEQAFEGRGLVMEAMHRVALEEKLVADTSHGLHTGCVWRAKLRE